VTDRADAPLFMQAWVAFLTAHTRVVSAASGDLEAACGISLAWFDVLFQLSVAPDCRRRMHEFARALLLSKSGLTRLVDRIEAAGLVARASVPGDRRSLYVELTPAGRRVQDKARPLVQGSVGEHFGKHLSEAELATLRNALDRVAHVAGAPPSGEGSGRRGRLVPGGDLSPPIAVDR
jgi:DNA-binding MarR family transcriptional regulator